MTSFSTPAIERCAAHDRPMLATRAGVQSLLDAVYERAATENRIAILGVSGLDGAGKSTFAAWAEQHYEAADARCTVLSVDDFLQSQAHRYRNGIDGQTYYEDAFNLNYIAREILDPLEGDNLFHGSYRSYDLKTDAWTPVPIQVQSPAVMIIEGVMIFRPPLIEFFDLKIWIDTDRELCLRRAMARERDIRHYGSAEKVAERYINRLYAGQMIHLKKDAPLDSADCIIQSDLLVDRPT